jgi:hypothetical protein
MKAAILLTESRAVNQIRLLPQSKWFFEHDKKSWVLTTQVIPLTASSQIFFDLALTRGLPYLASGQGILGKKPMRITCCALATMPPFAHFFHATITPRF